MADKLQLELILSAIDRASRPFRAVDKAASELTRSLKSNRAQLAELNATQSRIKAFRDIRNQADASRIAFAEQTAKVKALRAQLQATASPSRKLTLEMERAERALTKSKNAHIANLAAVKRSRQGLSDAGIQVSKLADHERELSARIASANALVDKQTAKLGRLAEQNRRVAQSQKALRDAQAMAGDIRGAGASALAGGAAVSAGPLAAIRAASDFEQAMLGVARQVQGARDANGTLTPTYYQLADGIQRMSRELPMASTEIAALVAAGARMGIQGQQNLLSFARTTAIAANAFDLPADEIGDNLAKIAGLYKVPIPRIQELGDVINWLDDQTLSKGGEIISVLQRMGDVADKLDYRNAAAFGSTFLSLGAAPEVAASATKALVRELSIATVQPKKFQAALAELGLSSADVQKRMATNASKTIIEVLERINAAAPDQRVALATRIFGKEFGDDASKIAQNLTELRKQIALTQSSAAGGSMGRENDARLRTQQATWQLLKNQLFNTAVVAGSQLAPSIIAVMRGATQLLTRVQAWIQQNPQLAGGIMKVALAGGAALSVFGAMSIGASAVIGPVAAMRHGVTLLATRFGPLLRAVVPFARNAIPMVTTGLRMLLPLLAGVSAPVLIAGAAIAGIAALIYKFWGPIKAFATGLFGGLRQAFAPVFGEMRTALAPLKPMWDLVANAIGGVWRWVKQLFTPFQATAGQLQSAQGHGRAFAGILSSTLVPAVRMLVRVAGLAVRGVRAAFEWSPMGVILKNWNAITGFFGSIGARMRATGAAIIDGLLSGIESRFAALLGLAKRVAGALPDTVRRALGINSPSRVFAKIGHGTAAGMALGIERGAGMPVRAMEALQGRVQGAGRRVTGAGAGALPALRPAFAGAAAGGGDTYTFNFHGPVSDPDAIQRAIRDALDAAGRRQAARGRSGLRDSGD